MKVNCKVTVYPDLEHRSIIDCVHCCQKMKEIDDEYDIAQYADDVASIKFSRYESVYSEEISYCPWCGEKIEYVLANRVRQVKHETQKVVNEVTYTEEEIP